MDQKYIDIYDEFTHSDSMTRRELLEKLTRAAGGAAAAVAVMPMLENNYVNAQTVAENLKTKYISYQGVSGKMRGYLARPKKKPKGGFPSVLVIHENRGLNPHIEDVARRAANAGFMALAVDALSPLGGTPKDMDEARGMIGKLDREKTVGDFVAGVKYLKENSKSNGKVGCVGFCWGGSMANQMAVNSPDMRAAVAFYGGQPKAEDVPKIKGAVMLHYAGLDERINAGIDAYKEALSKAKVEFEVFVYDNVNHAFHNDTNEARYNKEAAELAWSRTVEFWKKHLA
ncbi:MAG: dienelactone hydrolase family protein [Pyrinomonadaceae bacterium]